MKSKYLVMVLLSFYISGCTEDKNISPIAEWAATSIASKNPEKIAQLVGNIGVYIAPYGVDLDNPGHNNGHDFAKQFNLVLGKSNPVCMGYNYNNYDKILVFFKAPGMDWTKSPLKNITAENFALHFYRTQDTQEKWQLIWVTPVTQGDIEHFGNLVPCYPSSKK